MSIIFFAISFFVVFIFLDNMKLLWGGVASLFIGGICLMLFLLSVSPLSYIADGSDVDLIKIQKAPLVTFVVFKLCLAFFVKVMSRYPESTYWVFESKPWQDVLFNIITCLLMMIAVVVIYSIS